MSLMGIVNWLKKKIMGESKEESEEVKSMSCQKNEQETKIDAEELGKALVEAIEKEKKTGIVAKKIEENVGELISIRERLKRIIWRRETNNDRRLRHRPMIRVRAYIKAENNSKKNRRWKAY